MRKTIATSAVAVALTFGGAGIAQAATPEETATLAQSTTQTEDQDSDKTGLWGLLGLLGLGGLLGLKRRNDTHAVHTHNPAAPR